MPVTLGYKELDRQLKALAKGPQGLALRRASSKAMLQAKKQAIAAAPIANPPYATSSGFVDPYPKKTYKGRLVTPGFTSRSVRHRAKLSRDKRTVTVSLGVEAEAFYAIQFIEFGTSSIPARPWLEPAFRSSIGRISNVFRVELKREIDKALAR